MKSWQVLLFKLKVTSRKLMVCLLASMVIRSPLWLKMRYISFLMFTVSHGVAFGIASLPGPWIEKKIACSRNMRALILRSTGCAVKNWRITLITKLWRRKCGISKSGIKFSFCYPKFLWVCSREDRADVTHAISLISFKLSQFIRVTKLYLSSQGNQVDNQTWYDATLV